MVNDPLFESERNIEARQSKTPKKKRSITGISKIDSSIRSGFSKIKSPGFFKRGQKGNIDEAVSPVVDVRKGNIQILKEAGLAAVPIGKVSKLKPLSTKVISQINTKVTPFTSKLPSAKVTKYFFGGKPDRYQPAKPVTQSYYSDPDFEGLPLSAFTNKEKLRKVTTKQKIGIAGVGTGVAGMVAAPIVPRAKTTVLPKTRPMISVDTMEETLTKPITTTARPKTRPMISVDTMEEDLNIPNITIPEPSIPDITIPEINTPNITTPQIASDPFEEVGGGYGKSTDVDTEKTTDFDLENRPLIDPITKDEKDPFDLSDFYNPSKETPIGSTREDLTRKTLSLYDYGFDRNRFPGRASNPFEEVGGGYGGSATEPTKDPNDKPGVSNIGRKRKRRFRLKKNPGSKSDFDKRKSAALPYPSKVQYKEKDKYVTFNLNTNKKKVFSTPQGIGVNPGTTPEDTLKVIQKQKTKPKFKKYKLGNLVLSVTSPETIVIRRLRAFRNNKTNKRFRR